MFRLMKLSKYYSVLRTIGRGSILSSHIRQLRDPSCVDTIQRGLYRSEAESRKRPV